MTTQAQRPLVPPASVWSYTSGWPTDESMLHHTEATHRISAAEDLYNLYLKMHNDQNKFSLYKKTTQFLMTLCGDYALHMISLQNMQLAVTKTSWRRDDNFSDQLQEASVWYRQILKAFHQWSVLDDIAKLSAWESIQRRVENILLSQPKNVRSFREDQEGLKSIYTNYKMEIIYEDIGEVTGNCFPHLLSFDDDLRKILRLRGPQAQSFADLLDWVMDKTESQSKLYRLCERALRRLCGQAAILPSAYLLEAKDLKKTSEYPSCGGGFADVYEGIYKEGKVALKVLRYFGAVDVRKLEKSFYREAIIWKRLSHTNIVPFLGIADQKISSLCMVSTWMENGNLAVYLKYHPSANRMDLVADIARGLNYLHGLHIVHGDVKSGNVLISADYRARLTDFGLACVTHESRAVCAATTTTATIGSIRWMAPEILHPTAPDKGLSTMESDVYAFAMTMYETFTGQLPFFECSRDATVVINVTISIRPERPGPPSVDLGLSDRIWNIMEECWLADRHQRPRLPVILKFLEDERLHYVMPPTAYPSTTIKQRDDDDSDTEDEEDKDDGRYRDILATSDDQGNAYLEIARMTQEGNHNSYIELEGTLMNILNILPSDHNKDAKAKKIQGAKLGAEGVES